jgi:hypothetical protein
VKEKESFLMMMQTGLERQDNGKCRRAGEKENNPVRH